MMNNNVSFCGYNPTKLFGDLSAGDIAEAYRLAYRKAGEAVGLKYVPNHKLTGEQLKRMNPTDVFDARTNKLTEKGKKGFDHINKDLGVSSKSKTSEVVEAIKNKLVAIFYDEGDGRATASRSFGYFG